MLTKIAKVVVESCCFTNNVKGQSFFLEKKTMNLN